MYIYRGSAIRSAPSRLESTFVVNFVEIAFAGMQPMSSPHEIIAPSTGAGGTTLVAPEAKVPACHLAPCSDILVDGELFSGSSYILLKLR